MRSRSGWTICVATCDGSFGPQLSGVLMH